MGERRFTDPAGPRPGHLILDSPGLTQQVLLSLDGADGPEWPIVMPTEANDEILLTYPALLSGNPVPVIAEVLIGRDGQAYMEVRRP